MNSGRIEQEKAIFADNNEDAAEIALAEILTSGMELEELVPYLLSDLTKAGAD